MYDEKTMDPVEALTMKEVKELGFLGIIVGMKKSITCGILVRVTWFVRPKELSRPE